MAARSNSTAPAAARQDNVHRRMITRYLNTGNFFPFSKLFIRAGLSIVEAVVLQNLINEGARLDAESHGGWFPHTMNYMKADLGLARDPQQRVLNRLKNMKLIDFKQDGYPARRMVWIDLIAVDIILAKVDSRYATEDAGDSISSDLGNVVSRHLGSAISRDHNTDNRKHKSAASKTRSARPCSAAALQDHHLKWADRLHKTITRRVRVRWSREGWAHALRKAENNYTTFRVERALAWYEKNHERFTLYSPSAAGFRRDLLKLEKYMKKAGESEEQENVHPDTAGTLARLKDLTWPIPVKDQLRKAVNTSLNNISSLVASLRRFLKGKDRKALNKPHDDYTAWNTLDSLACFTVRGFYEKENARAVHFGDEWSGKLPILRTGPKGKLTQLCRKFALDSSGSEERWDDLEAKLDL